jgi:hypothetical protein
MSRLFVFSSMISVSILCCGCGGGKTEPAGQSPLAADGQASVSEPSSRSGTAADEESAPPEIPSISIGGSSAGSSGPDADQAPQKSTEDQRRELLGAMQPLQVMLGQWRGTTQRAVGDFNAVDAPEWIWDFQTDRDQPAMVMTSEASPYIRQARLTYLTDRELFQLTVTDPEGETRTYEGDFSEPAEDFQGDDEKMHVKYKLELTQVDADSPRDQWQIVFNQQENNRYLVELSQRRGSRFTRFDTIATQREGTSFARSDIDFGEKECIISGGLGTIQVSHEGKTYWVCCTGCKAAFEEDPATWIAEYQKKQAARD